MPTITNYRNPGMPQPLRPFHAAVVWNTGCRYTKHGQRMAAQLVSNNTVVFIDIDRGIHGDFIVERPELLLSNESLKSRVMHNYLHNTYSCFAHIDHPSVISALREAALTAYSLTGE